MMKKSVPLGIKLLSYIYAVNVALYILSLALFFNRVIIYGKEADIWSGGLIRLVHISIPIYIALGLRRRKPEAFFLAFYFHLFFLINNAFGFLESLGLSYTLIRIAGVYGSTIYSPSQIITLALNTLVNLLILFYLFKVKVWFFSKRS